ncbi:MAG: S41 family peptidase [Gemmatimonas sp.]|uniref:S41 family peptidase n=1 Tax=Gemmatimonas sp. TaxID=1962908 RepID=UPI00391FA956|nr:S41 family peptidase [Gemmatimonadota bacterium]
MPHRLLPLLLAIPAMYACRPATPVAGVPTPRAEPPPLPAACGVPASATVSRAGEAVVDPVATFDTAWTIIRRSHWDTTYNGVDWVAVRDELRPQAVRARTRGELQAVLSEMVGRLRQSHFSVIPQEVADGASGGSTAPRGGGALGFETRLVEGRPMVTRVDTGGPAWTAGVRTGWVVETVRGCPMAARLARLPAGLEPRRVGLMAYQIVTGALAGSEGDTMTVGFRDGRDRPRPRRLTHGAAPGSVAKVGNLPPLPAHLTWQRVRRDGRTLGIIRFNIWMPVLAAQFDAAMDSLRTADALVLDLRGNVGGIGGMSMGVAGHFLDSAYAIGTMTQRGSTLNFVANPRRVDTRARAVTPFAGPLAIVVDAMSVSTTEIFAGGLQAVRRATVFGTQTAGEALPSVPERLPNGDILYHAVADFIGPSGKPVEGDGVMPDRVIPLTRRALLDGHDAALEAALFWAARQSGRPLAP